MSHWLILPQEFFHKLPPSTHCSYHLKNLHHPAIYILLTARYYNFPKHKRVWDILLQLKFSCQLFHGPLSITGWVKWITLYICGHMTNLIKAAKKQGVAQLPHKLKSLRSPPFIAMVCQPLQFWKWIRHFFERWRIYVTAEIFGVCPFVLLAAKTTSFYSVSEWIICSQESVEIMIPL